MLLKGWLTHLSWLLQEVSEPTRREVSAVEQTADTPVLAVVACK
jgi:hypothetical protein